MHKVLGALLAGAIVSSAASARAAVTQWHPVDFSFEASGVANPFAVDLQGKLVGPGGVTLTIPGFYDGAGTFKVRVSAPLAGAYTLTTRAPGVAALDGKTVTFTAEPNADPAVHGALVVDPARPTALRWEDGTPYFLSGYECDWLWALGLSTGTTTSMATFLDKLVAQGFNHVLVQAYAYDTSWRKGVTGADDHGPAPRQPWLGTHAAPDYTQFDLEYWRHYDAMMAELLRRGVVAHLMFRVYNKSVTWPKNGSAQDDLYYRWIVARYAAYPNVVWDLTKEAYNEPDTAYKKGRLAFIRAQDGYHRLRTIHDDDPQYDSGAYDGLVELRTDQTHASYHQSIVKERGAKKWPVLNAEYGYEHGPLGSSDVTYGGSDSAETMADRAWQIALGGGYGAYYYTYTAWDVLRPNDTPPGYAYYKAFAEFFRTTSFAELAPADELVSGGGSTAFALANPGVEYVVYQPKASSFTLRIAGAKGPLEVRWVRALSGESKTGTPVSDGTISFSPPSGFTGPIALHLGRAATPPADAGPGDAGSIADAGPSDEGSSSDAATPPLDDAGASAVDDDSGGIRCALGASSGRPSALVVVFAIAMWARRRRMTARALQRACRPIGNSACCASSSRPSLS